MSSVDPVEKVFIIFVKAVTGLIITATLGLALMILGVINV